MAIISVTKLICSLTCLNNFHLKIAIVNTNEPKGKYMKKLMLNLMGCLSGMFLIVNPIYSEQMQNNQTEVAGSRKLAAEQHADIKQQRLDKANDEDERGELVTNGMYLTTHPMASHGIYKTSPLCDKVVLNDGSIWQVWFTSDWSVVSRWMYYNDQVIICPGSIFDATDYLLISQRTGEVVAVNLVEMEVIVGDPYFMGQRLWINQIDYVYDIIAGYYYYEIRLNDGSLWEVSSRDSFLCSLMVPGDVVFIGVDETLGSPTYNILVHFNSLEYIHADCVTR